MKTELFRVVQLQMADRYAHAATSSEEHAKALDDLLEESKASKINPNWDVLIATPFRYPLPTNPAYFARFKPPGFNRNTWYGGFEKETAIYEISFHFFKQRTHLNVDDTGLRTLFSCDCDLSKTKDICSNQDIDKIMDRNDYSESYKVAKASGAHSGIIYPSSRDPNKKKCAVMYDISTFDTSIKNEWTIKFTYTSQDETVIWHRHGILNMSVQWKNIS